MFNDPSGFDTIEGWDLGRSIACANIGSEHQTYGKCEHARSLSHEKQTLVREYVLHGSLSTFCPKGKYSGLLCDTYRQGRITAFDLRAL